MATKKATKNSTTKTSMTKIDYMRPDTGLTDKERDGVVETLTGALADLHLLYTKLRKHHWNVVGPQFISLHELLEDQYNDVKLAADRVAERIRAYGEPAIGTMQEFIDHTRLKESPGEYPEGADLIMDLVNDHEAIIRHLREDIDKLEDEYHDKATGDLFIELAQQHLEMAWMLRAFVQNHPGTENVNGSGS